MAQDWTAVIFAHNAADRVGITVEGLRPHVDEVVVVDIGSTDATAEVASRAGASVIAHPHQPTADTVRPVVLPQIESQWILILDDDEVPDAALLRTLTRIVTENAADVVVVPRLNYFFGEPVRGAGWQPEVDAHIRCFRRGTVSFSDVIHTKPAPRPGARTLVLGEGQGLLHHFSYLSVSQFLQRTDRYTTAEAALVPRGRLAGVRYALSSLYELGVRVVYSLRSRDGWRVRALPLLMIGYRAAAWAKARELDEGLDEAVVAERYRAKAASLLGVVQWAADVSEDGGRGAGYPPGRR